MTVRFPHLRAAIVADPWAITPGRLEAIAEVVERRVEGIRLSADEIAAVKGARQPNGTVALLEIDAVAGGGQAPQGSVIAVLSVFGIIAQHASQVDDISGPGGTSTERLAASLRAALNDPAVKAVVLNIDSPGGSVFGVQEIADEIFKARGQKPIVAQVNSLAASAAYWIAASADEIVVTPSGQVGSIGVYALHQDVSAAADKAGVKFSFISAGKYKVEGHPYEPLQDEARGAMQSTVDGYYSAFTRAVARGRGVVVDAVRNGFGEGRTVGADEAVRAGMADRVGTLDETLRRLGSNRRAGGAKAEDLAHQLRAGLITPNEALAVIGLDPLPNADEQEPPAAASAPDAAADAEAARVAAAAAEADAFRRRRHAHRLRSA